MATRFTKYLREVTGSAIVYDAFKQSKAKRKQTEHDLAVKAVEHFLGSDISERIKQIPEGWLPTTNYIYIRGFGATPLHFLEYRTLPNCVVQSNVDITGNTALVEAVAAHIDGRDHHKNENLLRVQVDATLKSFYTVEKFAEGWPEGYKHFPHHLILTPTAGLPAPRIADLDQRISVIKGV